MQTNHSSVVCRFKIRIQQANYLKRRKTIPSTMFYLPFVQNRVPNWHCRASCSIEAEANRTLPTCPWMHRRCCGDKSMTWSRDPILNFRWRSVAVSDSRPAPSHTRTRAGTATRGSRSFSFSRRCTALSRCSDGAYGL